MRWLWRQLFRIRTRLLLINALIVAVPLLGVGFARFYEGEMLRAVENDMVHQSQVVAETMTNFEQQGASAILRRAAHQTTTRLRVVNLNGVVVGDSAGLVGEVLDDRREIRRALGGRYGAATRVIPKRDVSVMFTAVPIVRERQVVGAVYASRSTTSVQVAMRRLRKSIFNILYYALGLTAILTLFFATTVSRPLAKLATRARRLARGDRRVALKLDRRDEIGELARALDDMATELDGRSSEVAELAANISHELKSPLTSMRGAAELLLDGAGDDEAARERFLNNILCDVDRLDRLVTRMLELSRARDDSESFTSVDLRSLAMDATEEAATEANVRVEVPERAVEIEGRPTHLTAAIRNLVDNAIAHGESGAPIDVTVSAKRQTATVTVTNRGAPISETARDRIWDRFYTTRGTEGGTGLGLPIVQAVARAHGGDVSLVESTSERTTFALAIPRRPAQVSRTLSR